MVTRVRESSDMQAAVRAFLELGNERNRLVHQNYATFAMEKTLDEVYELYRRSIAFVEALPSAFKDGDGQGVASANAEATTAPDAGVDADSRSPKFFRVVRHTLNEQGELAERAVLSGQHRTRGEAQAALELEAARNEPSSFDPESGNWRITDKDGRVHWLMIDPF